MKAIRRSFIFIVVIFALIYPHNTLANWYAGAQRTISANGITALISTPQTPVYLIQYGSSGESNWVSTYNEDAYGKDWMQAGWLIYWWRTTPWQYVEYCIDCYDDYGTYFMSDFYAYQYWGTTLDYWVDRTTGATWCASTGGYQRYCASNLHSAPVTVLAESEIHDYDRNSLDTVFDQVRYKNPSTGNWVLFDSNVVWIKYFPYTVDSYANYYFHTYRLFTYDVFLPITVKD